VKIRVPRKSVLQDAQVTANNNNKSFGIAINPMKDEHFAQSNFDFTVRSCLIIMFNVSMVPYHIFLLII
jgi:hypothetical protein